MRIGLNFGVTLYEYTPAELHTIARTAEALGFDSLWCGDHLIIPSEMPLRDVANPDRPITNLVPSPTTRVIFPPEAPQPDVFAVFTHMAAVTGRLRFGTQVFILPLRHPLVTARAAGTLDWLSGGRLWLGVGLGWLPQEFELAGVPWQERAARMDEGIAVLRAVWREDEPAYAGRFYQLGPCKFEPKPAQSGGPPILIGGETPAALRRVARLGDGWCARHHTPESLHAHAERLQTLRQEHGRADRPFELLCWLRRDATRAETAALFEAGATQPLLSMHGVSSLDLLLSEMERLSQEHGLNEMGFGGGRPSANVQEGPPPFTGHLPPSP